MVTLGQLKKKEEAGEVEEVRGKVKSTPVIRLSCYQEEKESGTGPLTASAV